MISCDRCSAFRTFNTIGIALSSWPEPSEQLQVTPHDFNTETAAQQTAENTLQPPTFSFYNPETRFDSL